MNQNKLSIEVQRRMALAGLGRYGLKIRCRGRDVALHGIVDVLADKLAAEQAARETPGVGRVENNITLCTDGRVADQDIALEVAEELAAELGTAAGIGVEVAGGRVVLLGQVDTAAEVSRAKAAASKARGVREIASELRLSEEVKVDGPSLVNAVESALAVDLGIQARRIRVNVQNGMVTMSGEVSGHESSRKAADIAARVPGVRQVENRIKVTPDPHEAVIAFLLERIEADPRLSQADLSFIVQEGRLVARGALQSLEDKRALDQALHATFEAYRTSLRGIDNAVRIVR